MKSSCKKKVKRKSHRRAKTPYTVHEIPHFLTNDECDKIIQIATLKGLTTSEVFEKNELTSTETINKAHRNSETAWLKKNNDIVERIAARIAEITNTSIDLQEDLQCVRYQKGGIFKEHYDAYSEDELCVIYEQGNRQRFSTFLIYLNDGYSGGETTFPKIKKTVIPEKGKAIYFKNINDSHVIIPESLHKGSRIKSGEKWIANIWIDVDPPEQDQDQEQEQEQDQEQELNIDTCVLVV